MTELRRSIQSLWVPSAAIESSRDKQRAEFAEIYDLQFDFVLETVRRLGGSVSDREDLVHDVFLRAHANLARFDASRPIRPWLFGIAFRVVSEHRRSGRSRFEVSAPTWESVSTEASPEANTIACDARAKVDTALQRLSEEQREVFVAHEICEVPIPDLVEVLNVPLNTLYSRLRLARTAFAAALREVIDRKEPR